LLVGSVDIETYGACERDWQGHELPLQQSPNKHDGRFHPMRSLLTDKVPIDSLILTTSVTIAKSPVKEFSRDFLCTMTPGDTAVFDMHRLTHRQELRDLLLECTHLLGMNFLYDSSYTRLLPIFRFILDHKHFKLLDLSIINYLESEIRTARSLKTLGPVLRTHSYDPETILRNFRFPSPTWKNKKGVGLHEYNAQDSHNTILAMAELSRRIVVDHGPDTPKLSPYCLDFYNDCLWSCLRMVEAGIPMSRHRLSALLDRCNKDIEETSAKAKELGILINGKGSKASKDTFIKLVADEVSKHTGVSVLDHPLLKLTDKKKEVSWSIQNRRLFKLLLPADHQLQSTLDLLDLNSNSEKLIGSYIQPLLYHKANDEGDQSSVLLGDPLGNGDVGIAYPTIYVVPSQSKDTSDDEGGQQQVRLSFKKPAGQTFPKPIKKAYASRFGPSGVIRSYDLKQAELRVAALLSGEPTLLTAFENDLDLHTDRAIETFGPSTLVSKYGPDFRTNKKFLELERQAAKHGNFTDLNWGSALTLRRTILMKGKTLIPMSLCESIVNARQKLRPVLWNWQNELVENTRRTHVVTLPFTGQSRTFLGLLQGNDVNECVNFPIQAVAAATTIRLQSFIHNALPPQSRPDCPCFMFLNCYDALYFDVTKAYLPTLDRIMADAMEWVISKDYWHMMCQHYGHPVPLGYDATTHT